MNFVDPSGLTVLKILNYDTLSEQQKVNVASAANARYGGYITQEQYEDNLRSNGAEFNSAIVAYNPELWNKDNIVGKTNCYAYAFNMTQSPDPSKPFTERSGSSFAMQPGMFGDISLKDLSGTDESNQIFVNAVTADAEAINYTFVSVDDVREQPSGTWKVLLVIAPNYDYHWLRVDTNGNWSHKQGSMPVGSQVIDPVSTAKAAGYSVVVGYFYVGPKSDTTLLDSRYK